MIGGDSIRIEQAFRISIITLCKHGKWVKQYANETKLASLESLRRP